jgi:hypothetical protein
MWDPRQSEDPNIGHSSSGFYLLAFRAYVDKIFDKYQKGINPTIVPATLLLLY